MKNKTIALYEQYENSIEALELFSFNREDMSGFVEKMAAITMKMRALTSALRTNPAISDRIERINDFLLWKTISIEERVLELIPEGTNHLFRDENLNIRVRKGKKTKTDIEYLAGLADVLKYTLTKLDPQVDAYQSISMLLGTTLSMESELLELEGLIIEQGEGNGF